MRYRVIGSLIFLLALVGCQQIALLTTPKKKPIKSTSFQANQAQQLFWNTLHQGSYQKIPQAEVMLMAAYLENPNDPTLASHLGFLHIWKLTERERAGQTSPMIVDEIILAKKYFHDSLVLNPQDARVLGFYGDTRLIEGKIFADQREQVRGYFTLKKAMNAWPHFNYFTAGYVMSDLSPNSKEFKEGLEWQWKTLDLCAHQAINRASPSFQPYMHLKTDTGPERACWNSWIAPYNFEGFFLNMGDMLVKAGEWQKAIPIYKNAQLAENYPTWPYRKLLENRIVNAKANTAEFQKNVHHDPDKAILLNSGYGCVACHQRF